MSNYWRHIYVTDDLESIDVYIQASVIYNGVEYNEIYSLRIFKNSDLTLGYYYYEFNGFVRLSKESIEYLLNEYDKNRILRESEPNETSMGSRH